MRSTLRNLVGVAAATWIALAPGCDCGPTPAGPCSDACATNQVCDDSSGEAVCQEECAGNLRWDGAACVEPPAGCAECDAGNRECNADGSCGDCVDGFSDDLGTCVPSTTCDPAPAEGSIAAECEGNLRQCVENVPGLAQCGACVAGKVPDDPADPDAGACRDPVVCADLSCDAGQFCIAPDGEDAYCNDECVTNEGDPGVEFPGGICAFCPACDAAGEDGPYLAALTGADRCICQTLDGYYWEEGSGTTKKCDADEDGFLNVSAQPALNATAGGAVATNARCDVRAIDRVVVVNVVGEELSVSLNAPTILFESERNDDVAAMARATSEAGTPELPEVGARYLRVEELNAFTKVCAGVTADFNDNGVSDVEEYQELDPMSVPASRAALRPFLPFGYFLELYRGYYVAPTGGETAGHFRVVERSRAESATRAVPLVYPDGVAQEPDPAGGLADIDAEYWRSCSRFQDPDYAADSTGGSVPTTHDFARLDDTSVWTGANHHAQFKCIQVVQQAEAGDPPHEVPLADVTGSNPDPILNSCEAGATTGPDTGAGEDARNPSEPAMTCTVVASVAAGDVGLAVVPFRPYGEGTGAADDMYLGGCINECAELKDTCPGYDEDQPAQTSCVGDLGNYGRLFCGCRETQAGTSCEVGCGTTDLRTSTPSQPNTPYTAGEFRTAPRLGWWLCGELQGASVVDADDGQSGGYKLTGGVVTGRVVPSAPLESASGGWTLR